MLYQFAIDESSLFMPMKTARVDGPWDGGRMQRNTLSSSTSHNAISRSMPAPTRQKCDSALSSPNADFAATHHTDANFIDAEVL
jgi:hypothetical protein